MVFNMGGDPRCSPVVMHRLGARWTVSSQGGSCLLPAAPCPSLDALHLRTGGQGIMAPRWGDAEGLQVGRNLKQCLEIPCHRLPHFLKADTSERRQACGDDCHPGRLIAVLATPPGVR
jgi:hypothetical protein